MASLGKGWHRWYAWFPVVDWDGNRKWLERVERCGRGYNNSKPWVYAPLSSEEAGGQGWLARLLASRVRGPAPKRVVREKKRRQISISSGGGSDSAVEDAAAATSVALLVTTMITPPTS